MYVAMTMILEYEIMPGQFAHLIPVHVGTDTLVHTFGIRAVPAMVRAKGIRLEIKEIPVTLTATKGGFHG